MKAWCWPSGLIEFGSRTPNGAIQIASGKEVALRRTVDVLARHGKGASAGCLLVPGVPEAAQDETDAAKGDALAAWLKWCAGLKHHGVKFYPMKEQANGDH